ncbi:2-octaprenylphenol hydroxylase [Sinobacterium norvegicum]|uniref:2-octaprenylphenol hydroxylase n=1 Tax=Sinobacterium norvegicum TaxID=1641715 RepID=A0ABN8EKJ0_9GAMM|nr:UbiH/UbiF/VisC/COQ6 family ubiquinone biosynthesis hydroxylase [Sinobacterium norvegicum]CAH0992867.1 2-octaprenylphenol hydroxylase [Sinobacterium norvegicum]
MVNSIRSAAADSNTIDYDVIVVGGGLAGSSMAAALADTDITVALIEQFASSAELPECIDSIDGFDPRVSALTPKSQRFLTSLGVWSTIESARVSPYYSMRVWDGEGTASLDFDAAEAGCDVLGHIVENRITIAALMARVSQARNIDVIAPAAVEQLLPVGDSWQLQLADGQQLSAALIVAADGANSPLRQQAGIETREWDYNHCGLVATVETSKPHQATAWQRFTDDGVLAMLPLASESERKLSIVWSLPPERAEQMMALSDDDFTAVLAREFEHRLGDISAVSRRFSFPLRQRHAKDYFRPGLALVADAAHTIHPLAGQGINLGLKDVEVLAEEILRAKQRHTALGSTATLSRYQRRRMADNLRMMSLMEALKRLFNQPALPVRWLRNSGMRLVSSVAGIKRYLIKQATEI